MIVILILIFFLMDWTAQVLRHQTWRVVDRDLTMGSEHAIFSQTSVRTGAHLYFGTLIIQPNVRLG